MFLRWKKWLIRVIYPNRKVFDFYRSRAGFWKGKKSVVCGFMFGFWVRWVGFFWFKCCFRGHFGRIDVAKLRKKLCSLCWNPVERSCRIKSVFTFSVTFCKGLLCSLKGCSKHKRLPCRTAPADGYPCSLCCSRPSIFTCISQEVSSRADQDKVVLYSYSQSQRGRFYE